MQQRIVTQLLLLLFMGGCTISNITPSIIQTVNATQTSEPTITITVVFDIMDDDNLPPAVKTTLDTLNEWDINELDRSSCPLEYSEQFTQQTGERLVGSGETWGWIHTRENILNQSGYQIRWNCEKMIFEIGIADQRPPNICTCQRIFITQTP